MTTRAQPLQQARATGAVQIPALLLRNRHSRGPSDDGFVVEHLGSTSTVMGLFDRWECRLAQVQLAPGDILVIYTDGVTEAVNADGEEFGENHLLEIAAAHRHLPLPTTLIRPLS